MRNAFVSALIEVAAEDSRVCFLTADLGFKIFDEFARRFPGRFLNVGVAEATMAGLASGLWMEGMRPFIYSIVPFAVLRCYEQIRNDLCYHHASVVVVGVGGGFSYGPNGPTHHGLEDIAVTRALPGMTVVCPGDPHETRAAVRLLAKHDGPAYLRLGRAGEPNVHPGAVELCLGKSLPVRDGSDVTLLATGNMLATAVEAAGLLEKRGVSARVVSMPFVKPLDVEEIGRTFEQSRAVVTLEEHSEVGGFGSAVADQVVKMQPPRSFARLAAMDRFAEDCGSQDYHRRACGLTPESVAERCLRLLEGQASGSGDPRQ